MIVTGTALRADGERQSSSIDHDATKPHFASNGNPGGNVNNHVDGYNYDAAGDVTTDSLNQYAYDGEGRLCAVYSGNGVYTEYIYDAEGNRVAKGNANDLSCNPTTDGFTLTASYVIGPVGEQLASWMAPGIGCPRTFLRTASCSRPTLATTPTLH